MRVKGQSEAEFTRVVIEVAKLNGWLCLHIRPGRTKRGWRTPVQGSGVGFPDLLLLKGSRLIVAECKTDTGKLTEAQSNWLAAFRLAGVETYIWRPSDWPAITAVLMAPVPLAATKGVSQ